MSIGTTEVAMLRRRMLFRGTAWIALVFVCIACGLIEWQCIDTFSRTHQANLERADLKRVAWFRVHYAQRVHAESGLSTLFVPEEAPCGEEKLVGGGIDFALALNMTLRDTMDELVHSSNVIADVLSYTLNCDQSTSMCYTWTIAFARLLVSQSYQAWFFITTLSWLIWLMRICPIFADYHALQVEKQAWASVKQFTRTCSNGDGGDDGDGGGVATATTEPGQWEQVEGYPHKRRAHFHAM